VRKPAAPLALVAVPAAGAVIFALLIGMGGLGQRPAWQVAVAGLCAAPGGILGALLFLRRKFVVGGLLVAIGVLSVVLFGDSGTPPAAGAAPVTAAARLAAMLSAGAWIWLYVPPALLASVFPNGRLPSRRWDWLLVGWAVVIIGFHASVALDPGTYGSGPGQVPGAPPLTVPAGPVRAVGIACLGLLLALLVGSVAAVLSRYRHGTALVRRQIRWFALSVCLLPVVLVAAWACYLLAPGAAGVVVEVGLLALFVTVPVGVAIGVLRHDLYDVDRLLSRTVAYSLVTVVLTAAFSVVVLTLGLLLGGGSRVTVALATVLCALAFTPVRRKSSVSSTPVSIRGVGTPWIGWPPSSMRSVTVRYNRNRSRPLYRRPSMTRRCGSAICLTRMTEPVGATVPAGQSGAQMNGRWTSTWAGGCWPG
jgi:hypothetical protein